MASMTFTDTQPFPISAASQQFPVFAPSFLSTPQDDVQQVPNRYVKTLNGPAIPNEPKNDGVGTRGNQPRRGRQKSLSEAIQTIRTRRASVTANAHEIADALKAPISFRIVVLCAFWYTTSILSSTSSKVILMALPKPITLTLVQFGFVSGWCIFLSSLSSRYPQLKTSIPVLTYGIRPPSWELIVATLPLAAFQISGHILSHEAMARIPVSLVHTIKGLSPLFTVLAYRTFFNVSYSVYTYLSLIPLTLGVVMSCSADMSGNITGLICAFLSTILFVTQNIVSKKLFNEAARAESDGTASRLRKPDKLNLLCYSSGLAFLFTFPIWMWSEGFALAADFLNDARVELSGAPDALDHGRLALEFIFNGTFHFGQNLVAFILLSMISPVTYSVASLIKRVFVICFAIIWFGNEMSMVQGFGIGLTFLGLYLYDRTYNSDNAPRSPNENSPSIRGRSLLPLVTEKAEKEYNGFIPSPIQSQQESINQMKWNIDKGGVRGSSWLVELKSA